MPSSKKEAKISVQAYPNAAKNEVVDFIDGVLRVKVAAPPVKGKANEELVALLSQVLGVDKSRVSISRGHTSRRKVIAIDGVSQEELMKRLSSSDGAASR